MGCIELTSIARSDVLMEDDSKKAPVKCEGLSYVRRCTEAKANSHDAVDGARAKP